MNSNLRLKVLGYTLSLKKELFMNIQNENHAKKIQDCALMVSAELNNSLSQMQLVLSDKEFLEYRNAVGKVLGEILLEILNPIHQTYPELIPSEMKND